MQRLPAHPSDATAAPLRHCTEMSDLFISYASEDRERAKVLAHALEAEGWSVWWDRLIPFGRPFDDVIQENLNAAKCVLVLWSKDSAASKWVRSEASEAEERGVLVPVMLDADVDIPLAFKLLHAANLADWEPGVPHSEYSSLVDHIKQRIAAPTPEDPKQVPRAKGGRPAAAPGRTRGARTWFALGFLVLPSVLAVAAALVLMSWRVPTQVELALGVDRLGFTLAGSEPSALLERPVTFKSLTIESLSKLAFSATQLRLVNPGGASNGSGLAPAQVVVEARPEERGSITIEAEADRPAAGRLEAISADPGTVVVLERAPRRPPA